MPIGICARRRVSPESALNGVSLLASDLPPGDRIIDRIERRLTAIGTSVRPSGGFNHFLVASHFASHPPATLSATTLRRFEALFETMNKLFTGP